MSTVVRLWQPTPIRRTLEVSKIADRLHHAVQISGPAASLAPFLPASLAPLLPAGLAPLVPEALTLATGPTAVHLARLTVSFLTG